MATARPPMKAKEPAPARVAAPVGTVGGGATVVGTVQLEVGTAGTEGFWVTMVVLF